MSHFPSERILMGPGPSNVAPRVLEALSRPRLIAVVHAETSTGVLQPIESIREIGGGLGNLAGKAWRVGLMGETSKPQNILYFLHTLEECLTSQEFRCSAGAGVSAASDVLAR